MTSFDQFWDSVEQQLTKILTNSLELVHETISLNGLDLITCSL